jgi:hypothetical protein
MPFHIVQDAQSELEWGFEMTTETTKGVIAVFTREYEQASKDWQSSDCVRIIISSSKTIDQIKTINNILLNSVLSARIVNRQELNLSDARHKLLLKFATNQLYKISHYQYPLEDSQ